MKQQILDKIAELLVLVNSLTEGDLEAQIVALQAEVAAKEALVTELQGQIAAKDAVIADQASKLAAVDALAKQIDATVPDPA